MTTSNLALLIQFRRLAARCHGRDRLPRRRATPRGSPRLLAGGSGGAAATGTTRPRLAMWTRRGGGGVMALAAGGLRGIDGARSPGIFCGAQGISRQDVWFLRRYSSRERAWDPETREAQTPVLGRNRSQPSDESDATQAPRQLAGYRPGRAVGADAHPCLGSGVAASPPPRRPGETGLSCSDVCLADHRSSPLGPCRPTGRVVGLVEGA